jgi:hypothetical protein
VICPKCGENNSANFRFCGMCGTSLEPRRPAGAPRTVGASDASRAFQNEAVESRMPAKVAAGAARTSQATIDSSGTSGPSFLGLNQPFREGNGNNSTDSTSPDESFSGLDSFFEQDEPGVSARGVILMVVLLVALGFAGWWAYTQYNGATSAPGAQPQTTAQTAGTQPSGTETSADNSASNPKSSESVSSASGGASSSPNPSANPGSSQPAAVPPAESANATPPPAVEPAVKPKGEGNPPAAQKPAEETRSSEQNHAPQGRKTARADLKPATRPAAAVATAGDKGDAEFKKGEAYLYGRGMPENCNQAIKSLKEASAKQNAKARGTFGTMYATGHCVPRDLPTSYSWFAQALRADPNNQILEKDLTAVWNQMTPPERQMATRNKQ